MKDRLMNLFRSRLLGVGVVFAGVVILAIMSEFDLVPPATPISLPVIVLSAYIGGLRVGLFSVVVITLYSQFVFSQPIPQFILLTISGSSIAILVGILKRHARLSESINGNLRRLQVALEITRDLKLNWDELSDLGKYKKVAELEDVLGNLAALVFGWESIRKAYLETRELVGLGDERD